MSIVSVVSGRIRLESSKLIGKAALCHRLCEKLNGTKGVIEAEINPRTGRVLVRFDELQTQKEELVQKAKEIVNDMEGMIENSTIHMIRDGNGKAVNNAIIHAATDIAWHMLMPKPLGVLLPIAINALRKI